MAKPRFKKGCLIFGGIFVVILGVLAAVWGPVFLDLNRAGFFEQREKATYDGTSMENLKALHTAMMLYHDSEGQLPFANGWMDAISNRIRTDNMPEEEAKKKFINPAVADQPGAYGYAMNKALEASFTGDISEPSQTPLLFDSSDLSRNANGTPEQLLPKPPRPGGNLGISVDGNALKLP